MPQHLSPNQRDLILRYITEGKVLEDQKGVVPTTIRDTGIAEQIYNLLNQDPTLDVRRTIRSMGVSDNAQILRIEEIVELFVSNISTMSRQRAQFIVEKSALNMIKMGDSIGDWHAVNAGTDKLIKVHHLDQPEQEQDRVKETWLFPMVLAPVESVGPDKHSLTDEQKQALFKKYGAQQDETEALLREKVALKRAQYSAEDAKEIPLND